MSDSINPIGLGTAVAAGAVAGAVTPAAAAATKKVSKKVAETIATKAPKADAFGASEIMTIYYIMPNSSKFCMNAGMHSLRNHASSSLCISCSADRIWPAAVSNSKLPAFSSSTHLI